MKAVAPITVANRSSDPTTGRVGDVYFNTTSKTLRSCIAAGTPGTWINYDARPVAADAVRFVSPLGSDANDGLSAGSAKLTLAAAITDLPAAGGIIYVLAGNYNVTATVQPADGQAVDIYCAPGVTFRASSSITGPVFRYKKITQNPGVGIHGGPVIDMNNEAGAGATIGLEIQDCWMMNNDVRIINPGSGTGIHWLTVDINFGAYYNRVHGQARAIKATGTATVTNGSANLTLVTPTTLWKNGMVVTGNGIPAGTTISSGAGTATMVMSAPAGVGGGAGTAIEGRRGIGAQVEGAASNNAANNNIASLHCTGFATAIKSGPFVDGFVLENPDCTDNAIAYDLTDGHTVGFGVHEELNVTEGIIVRAGATAHIDSIYNEKKKAETTGVLKIENTGDTQIYVNSTLSQEVMVVPGIGTYRRSFDPAAGRWSFLEDGSATPLQIDNLGIKVNGGASANKSIRFPSYTTAQRPSAATHANGVIYVSDASAGAQYQFSDGTNWLPLWTTVTYGTNWQRKANAAADEVQAITSIGGAVQLRGRLERITSTYTLGATTIMTLPVGCRPGRQTIVWVMRSNSTEATNVWTRMVISTGGVCTIDQEQAAFTEAIGDYINLDGVNFNTVA